MTITVQYGGAVIHCETSQELKQVIDALGLTGESIPGAVFDPGSQVGSLIANLRGTKQEHYLRLIAENPAGIAVSEIIQRLKFKGIPALNGTWSGVSKNCKKLGFQIPVIIERKKRPSDGQMVHKPTELFLKVWRKSTK